MIEDTRNSYGGEPSIRQDPVFIVGFPRSGTTLLQSLLVTQEGLISFPETHFFKAVKKPISENSGNDPVAVTEEFNALVYRYTGIQLKTNTLEELPQLFSQNRVDIKKLFELIVQDFMDQSDWRAAAEKRWIEKTPAHVNHLETLHKLYPQAQIIFMMRSPVPAICSCQEKLHPEKSICALAARWKRDLRSAERFARTYPTKIRFVRYEDLIADVPNTIKKLCDWLGENYAPHKLTAYGDIVEKLSLPWETWKKNNSNKIKSSNQQSETDLDFANKAIVRFSLRKYKKRYNYESKNFLAIDILSPFMYSLYWFWGCAWKIMRYSKSLTQKISNFKLGR